MLPGRGYTTQMPLLFWTTQLLLQHGWTTTQAQWPDDERLATDPFGVVAGGTADEQWSSHAAGDLGAVTHELTDADHSLHVAGSWRASLTALSSTLAAIEDFLVGL